MEKMQYIKNFYNYVQLSEECPRGRTRPYCKNIEKKTQIRNFFQKSKCFILQLYMFLTLFTSHNMVYFTVSYSFLPFGPLNCRSGQIIFLALMRKAVKLQLDRVRAKKKIRAIGPLGAEKFAHKVGRQFLKFTVLYDRTGTNGLNFHFKNIKT